MKPQIDYQKKYKRRYMAFCITFIVIELLTLGAQIYGNWVAHNYPPLPGYMNTTRIYANTFPFCSYIACIAAMSTLKYKTKNIGNTNIFVYRSGNKVTIGVNNKLIKVKYSKDNRYYKLKVSNTIVTIDLKKGIIE